MPRFAYRAKDSSLKMVEGTIEADSEAAAIRRLDSAGVYPLTITETAAEPNLPADSTGRRVPARQIAYLSRQLADLLDGGLSLFNALSLLSEQTEHRLLRGVIADVAGAVRDGQAFSDAISQHPAVFSPLYVNMIRTAEAGGDLSGVLIRLADVAEHESELRSRVASALVYPLVVLGIGLITIVVLLTYVVPKLTSLFAETGQLLPLPTRILLAISRTLSAWWWVWVMSGVGLVWGLQQVRRSPTMGAWVDRVLLRLPLGGSLVRKLETARWTRNLGILVGQGVPMVPALAVAGSTVSNALLRHALHHVQEAVQDGASLAAALSAIRQFPAFVSNMVAVGEESGTLETALLKIAASYERETDRTLRTLTTILEPALIVAVGLVVMGIVLAMLLPIFQIGLVAS